MTVVGTAGYAKRVEPPSAAGHDARAVLAVDVFGHVIYVNAAVESLSGQSRHDLLGQPLSTVLRSAADEEVHPAAALTRRAMGENRRVWSEGQWVPEHREVPPLTIELHAAPIHDRDGRVTGAVVVLCNACRIPALLQCRQRYDVPESR